jgi:hypothetical protein
MTELLKTDYLFSSYRRFPWDILGLTVPKVGPVHSYLTSILAPWGEDSYREFMRGSPSWREVQRAARVSGSQVLVDIASYCSQLYELRPSDRADVAQEVLNFLFRNSDFRLYVQKTLDRLYLQDLILVPEQVRPR